MLTVSRQAASVIDDILTAREELPDEAGVRIKTVVEVSDGGAPQPAISLELVEAPEAGDEVLDEAPVFLEPEAAALLDDKLLDADLAGEEVRFAFKQQS